MGNPHGSEYMEALGLLEAARPSALRQYDQIPMLSEDLLAEVLRVAPELQGRSVAFVGDHDGTSLLIGLLGSRGLIRPPAQMLLVDFDDRLLVNARTCAEQNGFGSLLETRLYNVFSPVPRDLLGRFEVFYTNPPYGAYNEGASARLFITRGCELVQPQRGRGYLLLPDSPDFPWSQRAMQITRCFLYRHGWNVVRQDADLHRYHLDDAPELRSSLVVVERRSMQSDYPAMPWATREVAFDEVPFFYGESVSPPYPRYISADGQPL